MRAALEAVGAAAIAFVLSGCLFSATEVVGPQDAVLVPGVDGEYYTLADPRTKGTVPVAGRLFEAPVVNIRANAATREYPGVTDKGPIRLMPVNDRFHLMQMPMGAAFDPRPTWLLALVRIDTRAGFIDLHCAIGDLKPVPVQPPPSGQGQNQVLAAFIDGRGRAETIEAVRLYAAGSPPLMRRLVRKDVAEQGLPESQALPASIAACSHAWINVAGGMIGGAVGSISFLDFLRGMIGARPQSSAPPQGQTSPQGSDAAQQLLQQLLQPKKQ